VFRGSDGLMVRWSNGSVAKKGGYALRHSRHPPTNCPNMFGFSAALELEPSNPNVAMQ